MAQQATTDEAQRRRDAEAEQDRLAEEAKEAQQRLDQAAAREVLQGLGGLDAADDEPNLITATLSVTPHYRAAAGVSGPTDVTFVNPTTGSEGRWFRTEFSHTGGQFVDRMHVYSDAEAPDRVDFKDSTYRLDSNSNPIVDGQGNVVGAYTVQEADGEHTASSAFPRTSSPPERARLVHRGMNMAEFESARGAIETDHDENNDGFTPADRNTQGFRDALEAAGITTGQYNQYVRGMYRNEAIYPFRYTFSAGGTLQGANGAYRCGSATDDPNACTVQKSGDHFVFVGTWTFRPSSGTTDVLIADSQFMWFGWWSPSGCCRRAVDVSDLPRSHD